MFLWYIKFLAELQLKKNNPLIIGVTGSAGKTSTLNAIEAVLTSLPEKKIKISHKANSEVGLPLNILGITVHYFNIKAWAKIFFLSFWKLLTNWKKIDIYVAEMGIDSPFPPKNMDYLLSFLKPNIGIFLNADAVHSETFDCLVKETDPQKRNTAIIHAIAQEKGKLITSLPSNGFAILNEGDLEVAKFIETTPAKVFTFGMGETKKQLEKTKKVNSKERDGSLGYKKIIAKIILTNWKASLQGTTFEYLYRDNGKDSNKEKTYTVQFSRFLLPKNFGLSLAAALNVGLALDIPLGRTIKSLEENLVIPPGRSSLIPGTIGSFIIDSSYNASLQPMLEMLDLLDELEVKRKIAVLGDMREMGDEAREAHQEVIKKALEKTDLLILIGPLMKKYAAFHIDSSKVYWFPNAQQVVEFLKPKLKKDDLILVKASQNTLLLEIIVEQLMLEPHTANELLCRRGAYWNKKREQLLK